MNQPAIWGSPIYPFIAPLVSRHQRPVQTTAGSDVPVLPAFLHQPLQSGHLQVTEVRWHRHLDENINKTSNNQFFHWSVAVDLSDIHLALIHNHSKFCHMFFSLIIFAYDILLVNCAATYLTRKADTGMERAPQIWRGRTHFDPQRLFYGLNRMGMWWQTFLPAISCHVKSHICSLSARCIF